MCHLAQSPVKFSLHAICLLIYPTALSCCDIRLKASDKALGFLSNIAAYSVNIVAHGAELILCFHTVINGSDDELRQRSLVSLENVMSSWQTIVVNQLEYAAQNCTPSAILDVIQCVHSIERCKRPFLKKRLLMQLMQNNSFRVDEYLGWCVRYVSCVIKRKGFVVDEVNRNPNTETPQVERIEGGSCRNIYQLLTNSLVYTYLAQYIGMWPVFDA